MDKKGLVTVVAPVYKTEKYLDRCLESIVNQTYRNLEIILVDDGSPDNCPQMCDAWAQKDSRIRVIHKENAGLGMARNTGIENATGEYICFFDSDDYILPETIEKTYNKAIAEEAEVVVFGFSNVNAGGNITPGRVPSPSERTFRGQAVCGEFLPELIAPDPKGNGKQRFYMSACMMLFSLEALKRTAWKFVSERENISEDVYFLLGLFRYIQSVAVVPEALYCYCTNETSLSRKYLPGRYARIRHFYEESIALSDRLKYGDEIRNRLSKPYIHFTIAALKQEMASNRPFVKKKQSISEILRDPVLQKVLEEHKDDSVNWKQKSLFWTVRNKKVLLCCALLTAQNVLDRR